MAGSDHGDEYSDYETQSISLRQEITSADAGSSPSLSDDRIVVTDPVSERGIDRDEIAELVGFRRYATAYSKGEEEANTTQAGLILAEGDLGINLNPEELPTQNTVGSESLDTVTGADTSQKGGILRGKILDAPGVLDSYTLAGTPSQGPNDNITDPAGGKGSGSFMNAERQIYLRDWFGTGPFLDATDDVTIHTEIDPTNVNTNVVTEVQYQLYWHVTEMPEGRSSLGRP